MPFAGALGILEGFELFESKLFEKIFEVLLSIVEFFI